MSATQTPTAPTAAEIAAHRAAWVELGRNIAALDAQRDALFATFERLAPATVKAQWDRSATAGMLGTDADCADYLRRRAAERAPATAMRATALLDQLGALAGLLDQIGAVASTPDGRAVIESVSTVLISASTLGVVSIAEQHPVAAGGLASADLWMLSRLDAGWVLGNALQLDALASVPGLGDELLRRLAAQLRAALLAAPAE